jgi:hypothetical protein
MPRRKKAKEVASLPRTRKQKIEAFLAEYAVTARISLAAQKAGVRRGDHYKWLEKDPDYVQAFEHVKRLAADYVQAEIVRRAVDGYDEDVFYQGQKCGTIKRYSDGLMILLAKGMMPEMYGTQKTEISGPQGQPVQAKIEVVFIRPQVSG